MKYFHFTFALAMLLPLLSCKKDADLDLAPFNSPEVQPFFVRGELFDNRDTSIRTFAWDMELETDEYVVPGVASATGAGDASKYIVAIMGFNAKSWGYNAPFANDPDNWGPYEPTRALVGVKFTSDRPASEYEQPFSKAELENLIQPGSYTLGQAPGQVELVAIRPTDDLRLFLPSIVMDQSFNQFEVLSVEDYYFYKNEFDGPTQGKIVHFRGQVVLDYEPAYTGTIFYLKVEGKLLFAYD